MQLAASASSRAPTPERCPGSVGSSSLGTASLVLQLPHPGNTPAGAPRDTWKKHTQHLYFQPIRITLSSPSTHWCSQHVAIRVWYLARAKMQQVFPSCPTAKALLSSSRDASLSEKPR